MKNRIPTKPSTDWKPPSSEPNENSSTIRMFAAIITPTPVSSVLRRPNESTTSTAATTAKTENSSMKPCTSSDVVSDQPSSLKIDGL